MEIFVLRRADGGLVPPVDDDGTDVFLAWPTLEDARRGLEKQERDYEVEAKVERLF